MTPCERLRQGLADGDPALLTDPTLRDHLAGCASCTAAAAADAALRQALAALARPSLSPDLRRRLTTLAAAPGPAALPALRGGDGDKGRPTAPFRADADARPPRSGRPAAVPGRRERLLALLLLAACLAGLAFALRRLRPLPADRDGTPRPSPTAPTREASGPSPSAPAATAWPSPPPPLPPLPTVLDDSLALPEGALVVLRDEAGLLLFRGAEPGRRLLEDERVRSFKISPDGRWVAFEVNETIRALTTRRTLWVLPVTGGPARQVVDEAALTRATMGFSRCRGACTVEFDHLGWNWTPDSAALAFNTLVNDEPIVPAVASGPTPSVGSSDFYDRQDLWVQPISGGAARRLFRPGKGGHFVYSPDGAYIAISQVFQDAGERGESRIAVARTDGSGWRRLLTLPDTLGPTMYPFPQWTSDSRHLLLAAGIKQYISPESDVIAYSRGSAKLLRLGLDGSVEAVAEGAVGSVSMDQLHHNGYWSPNGEWLAYRAALPNPENTAQASAESSDRTYPHHDSTAYPEPVAIPSDDLSRNETGPIALIVATTAGNKKQAYDWPRKHTSVCFAPSGLRFAYLADAPPGSPGTGLRIGKLGEAPRSLPHDMVACHWLSDDLLLLRDEQSFRLIRVDAHQRLLASAGGMHRVSGSFGILMAPTTAATPAPLTRNPLAPPPLAILRTYTSHPLFRATHFGGIGFINDRFNAAGPGALVMAWDSRDLPSAEPQTSTDARTTYWPEGQGLLLSLESGKVCLAGKVRGQAVPGRADAAFQQIRLSRGGLLMIGSVNGQEGLFWQEEACSEATRIPLPGDEDPISFVDYKAYDSEALIATKKSLAIMGIDRGAPRTWAIDGLRPSSWTQARWSPQVTINMAILSATAKTDTEDGAKAPATANSGHELVVVDRYRQVWRNLGTKDSTIMRIPIEVSEQRGAALTRIDWLGSELLLLRGAKNLPDSVISLDGQRRTVAEHLGLAASSAKGLHTEVHTAADGQTYHLLIHPEQADQEVLLYHSESGTTESLGAAGRGQHFTVDGRVAWTQRSRLGGTSVWSRPIDPPGSMPAESTPPCGLARSDDLAGHDRVDPETASASTYVELRPGGQIALREVRSCAVISLVAIKGVNYVQQAHLSPDSRYLVVVGGSSEFDEMALYRVDRWLDPDTAHVVQSNATVLPVTPSGSAKATQTGLIHLVDVATSLPYPSADWEPAPTAEPNRGPALRSRSVPGCQVSLGGGREGDGPGQAYDAGQYTALIERSNGFGAAYVLEADDAEASFDGRILEARFTPQTWAACDQAVRRLIEGLP